jgi:hypothetical protein
MHRLENKYCIMICSILEVASISSSTVVEFEYQSDQTEPEIGAIGFDNDTDLSSDSTWQVYGTQVYGIQDDNDYTSSAWKSYSIPVGATITGSYSNLFFANDFDGGSGSNSLIKNIVVYDTEQLADNDDGSPTYTETGSWTTSGSTGYNGGTYRFVATAAAATASWDITIPKDGTWKIEVQYVAGSNRATSTAYSIDHDGGTASVNIDQTQNSLTWVTLGSYSFSAGTYTVTLDAQNSSGGNVVISDAIRAIKQ